jgi:imidazole glycerol phosphate synthase subunit HisF
VDGQFTVFAKGGRENTGMEAISWIKRCVDMGAGEVVLNSIDTDGVKKGFDLEMLDKVCNAVNVPVIASGGAGCVQDFVTLFNSITSIWTVVVFGVCGSIISQIGDLFASFLKRRARVKDYGTIFPGHGGIMDRVDGLIFNSAFVLIYILILL